MKPPEQPQGCVVVFSMHGLVRIERDEIEHTPLHRDDGATTKHSTSDDRSITNRERGLHLLLISRHRINRRAQLECHVALADCRNQTMR